MLKNLRVAILNVKLYPLLRYAIITQLVVSAIVIGITIWQNNNIKNIVQDSLYTNRRIIETVTMVNYIANSENQVSEKIQKKQQILQKQQEYDYEKFLEKFFEHQSYFLNFWISILTIILSILAIVIPLCFIKFFEDKRKEMNKIIRDCIRQKEQTEINLQQMQTDLTSIKDYVKEAKKSAEQAQISQLVASAFQETDDEKAISLLSEALKLNENLIDALILRATRYIHREQLDLARQDLDKVLCLDTNNIDGYLGIGIILLKQRKFDEAIDMLDKIPLEQRNFVYHYNKAEIYIYNHKFDKALEQITLSKNKGGIMLEDDRRLWIEELNKSEQTPITKEIINLIERMPFRKRQPNE